MLFTYLKSVIVYRIKSKPCGITYQGLCDLFQSHLSHEVFLAHLAMLSLVTVLVHVATYAYVTLYIPLNHHDQG